MSTEAPPPAARPRAPVIRLDTGGEDLGQRILKRQIPAWFVSLALHVVLLGGFAGIGFAFGPKDTGAKENVDTAIDTKMDEEEKDKNFENPDIGLDPNLPTNYNIDRIEDHSIPGPLKPEEQIGNQGLNDPTTVPPPPGIVTPDGQGGGAEATALGTAPLGTAGGMGGPGGYGVRGTSGATRKKVIEGGGGNAASEAAVVRG